MLYDISDPKFRAAVLAFMLARKAAARRAALESEIDRVKRRMEQRRIHAMSQLVLYSCAADESSERRHVQRNSGKWRGSTISGYLRGDDQTYVENFRMNSGTTALPAKEALARFDLKVCSSSPKSYSLSIALVADAHHRKWIAMPSWLRSSRASR